MQDSPTAPASPATQADLRRLRDAFGTFLSGVTVVTAAAANGAPLGFTANSFTSVSLSPPLLLVCPARALSSFPVFNTCRHFAVNILSEEQRDIANRFAARGGDRFAQLGWAPCAQTAAPLLRGCAATFSCQTEQRVDAGDHIILIGRVAAYAAAVPPPPPLGYAAGGYFTRALERRADELTRTSARRITAGIILEHNGKVLMCQPRDDDNNEEPRGDGEKIPGGKTLPQVQLTQHTGALAALRQMLAAARLRADIGAVYAVVENPTSGAHSLYYRGTAADDSAQTLGDYHAVEDLEALAHPSIKSMLRRYCMERRGGSFGLYIGDAHAGDVHHPAAR